MDNNCKNNHMHSCMNNVPYRNPAYSNANMNAPACNAKCDVPQVVAMAYVPWQVFGNVYDPGKGFSRGTIFPELDKPFKGGCRS